MMFAGVDTLPSLVVRGKPVFKVVPMYENQPDFPKRVGGVVEAVQIVATPLLRASSDVLIRFV